MDLATESLQEDVTTRNVCLIVGSAAQYRCFGVMRIMSAYFLAWDARHPFSCSHDVKAGKLTVDVLDPTCSQDVDDHVQQCIELVDAFVLHTWVNVRSPHLSEPFGSCQSHAVYTSIFLQVISLFSNSRSKISDVFCEYIRYVIDFVHLWSNLAPNGW